METSCPPAKNVNETPVECSVEDVINQFKEDLR